MKYTNFIELKEAVEKMMQEMNIKRETIKQFFNCKRVFYMKLSEVNVMPENRPGSKSKQTHIHISGKNMNMFYPAEQLEQAKSEKKSTDDERVNIYLSGENIRYLEKNKKTSAIASGNDEPVIKTYTYKKISIRADGSEQVQLSKFRLDDKVFLDFRKLLYVHYGLLFFERKDGQGYNVMGITEEFSSRYNINVPALLLDNEQAYAEINEEQANYEATDVSEGEEEDNGICLNNIDTSLFNGIEKPAAQTHNPAKRTERKAKKGRKKNYIKEQKNKQEIGEFGEQLIFNAQKAWLKNSGYSELADKVEWTAKEHGDGLGYDIKSFYIDENGNITDKYIEVKTTLGRDKPFEISINEVEKSDELSRLGKYILLRVYNVDLENRTFNYYYTEGPIEKSYKLSPTVFLASKL